MKRSFSAKSAKSCLPSTHWIVANHKIEGAVSVSVAGKNCRPMDATTIERHGPACAIDAELGRDGRAIGINHGRCNWVCFVKPRGQPTCCHARTVPDALGRRQESCLRMPCFGEPPRARRPRIKGPGGEPRWRPEKPLAPDRRFW